MALDINKYLHYMDRMSLTPEQKEETIRIVWGLMESAVDQAFGVHPIQQYRGYVANDNLQSPVEGVDSKRSTMSGEFKDTA